MPHGYCLLVCPWPDGTIAGASRPISTGAGPWHHDYSGGSLDSSPAESTLILVAHAKISAMILCLLAGEGQRNRVDASGVRRDGRHRPSFTGDRGLDG